MIYFAITMLIPFSWYVANISIKILKQIHSEYLNKETNVNHKQEMIVFSFGMIVIGGITFFKIFTTGHGYGEDDHQIFVPLSFALLYALSVIDLKTMYAPDNLNFAALVFALIGIDIIDRGLNAGIAMGSLYLFTKGLSLILKKQVMGPADLIIAATMAAILGLPGFFTALFFSAILSALASGFTRKTTLPFIPFLALATFMCYIFDEQTIAFIYAVQTGTLF